MSRLRFLRTGLMPLAAIALLAFTTLATAQDVNSSDPPDRVARLAYQSGDVQLAPAGVSDWGNADLNRPLVTGDRLLTGDDGRAALELGDASVRIDHDSAFNFLNLDNNTAQVELTQGTLNLRVRRMDDGQSYEIDTPTVAFVASQPGAYRIDDDPNGNGAMVTVFEGAGVVYGENGVSRAVNAGSSYRFDNSQLTAVEVNAVPPPDDFDRFCETRDNRYANSISSRYVAPDVIGADDLDNYGNWDDTPDYGNVWYPTAVPFGWAPYRNGHWTWIDPWGWTWVDDSPWGFAPFHYGRWAYIGSRWGWIPGPIDARPYYAPALVAFVGGGGFSLALNIGGGGPVGWFPLGPRDVYVPWYHGSRQYFNNVNVTNIRNVYVNKTVINNVYNDYSVNKTVNITNVNRYAYRNMPGAVTAVPRNVFAGARPVQPAMLHLNRDQLARAQIAMRPQVTPQVASLGVRPAARPIEQPARAFNRTVIARQTPPPAPAPFQSRLPQIAKQGGEPLTRPQLQTLAQTHAQQQPATMPRVRLATGAAVVAGAVIGAEALQHHAARPGENAGPRPMPAAPPHQMNAIRPIPAPMQPAQNRPTPPRETPMRPGELPSARFAHPQREAGTLPQPPRIAPVAPQQAPREATREPRGTQPQPGYIEAPRNNANPRPVPAPQERPVFAPREGAAPMRAPEQRPQPPREHFAPQPYQPPRASQNFERPPTQPQESFQRPMPPPQEARPQESFQRPEPQEMRMPPREMPMQRAPQAQPHPASSTNESNDRRKKDNGNNGHQPWR